MSASEQLHTVLERDWHSKVPVAPFKRRFRVLKAQGVTAGEIALRLGWRQCGRTGGDSKRFLRAIGLAPTLANGTTRKEDQWNRTITPKTAKRIAEAMDCDPVDLNF